ncbi:tetratricopeptide repeat protein [Desulfobacula sp.]|uniref:tetratricopeptide repeat protein n=1 Tax=Desulfobacula sp. TaxID=2593537 RepID=UPI0025C1058A|nr:tetratricopeptide repeat protein [Desulfobacula sp.]MBC2705564.1 tetratricopeptide repeat protein [Desulfobacula sp.]
MKIIYRAYLCLFVLILLNSPTFATEHDKSKIECGVQAGAQVEVIIPIEHEISLRVNYQMDDGLIIHIVLSIPKNTQIKFQTNSFAIKDFLSGNSFERKVTSIYEGNVDFNLNNLPSRKIDIYRALQGDTITDSKVGKSHSKSHKPYSILLSFKGIEPKQFKLILPEIEINKQPYRILSICFDRTVYEFKKIQLKSNTPITIRSVDYPNQLWIGLDATVNEIHRDGRISLFKISEEKGTQGAGAMARFLACCITYLANQRGYKYFVSGLEDLDSRILVVFLKKKEEDIKKLLGKEYSSYILEDFIVDTGLFSQMCGFAPLNESDFKTKVIDEIMEMNPNDDTAYYMRAETYLRKAQYDKAISDYTKAIQINPEYAMAYYYRGLSYVRKGQYEKAIIDFTRATEIEPKYDNPFYNRGLAYKNQGQYDKAFHDFSKAIEINPNYEDAYLSRGVIYLKKEQFGKSISDFTKAIELDPKFKQAYYNRGIAYRKQGKYPQAIQDNTKAIELDPKYVDAYYNRGIAYWRQGKYPQAIQDNTKVVELDPKHVNAYNNRGIAYWRQGKYPQAIHDYNKAIELDPKYVNAYYNRGIAYDNQDNYTQAIQDYTKAIELDPKFKQAYNKRAYAYKKQGKFARAIQDFTKIVELDPKNVKAYNSIGWIYATAKDKSFRNGPKAVNFALKAVSLSDTVGIMDTLGAAYVENQQYEKAIKTYKTIVGKDKSLIKVYQKSLKDKGCYSGQVDGVYSQEFENAIRSCVLEGNYL